MSKSMGAGSVSLRNVARDDLPRMYQMQLDPESNRLAVTNPRSAEAFDAHWAEIQRDPNVNAKAILLGEEMVGYISCFIHEGQANVGYWIGREHWGRGVASRALELLLLEVAARPLYAHVATGNAASLRILQKCGFVIERVQMSPASDRYPECEEAALVLNECVKQTFEAGSMIALHHESHFTFPFADDRIIPRFHLGGIEAGRQVSVFKLDTVSGERLGLIATATVGEGGWVDLAEPIIVRAGEGFVVVPEERK